MLGKTTEYALRALVYVYLCNTAGKRPGFKEIAVKINSPEQFTAKILQNMTRAGLLRSVKGRGGGFFYKDPAAPLSLYEVIRITEGEDYFKGCGFGLSECDDKNPCPLHYQYSGVRNEFLKFVQDQTIQSLAGRINSHEAVLIR